MAAKAVDARVDAGDEAEALVSEEVLITTVPSSGIKETVTTKKMARKRTKDPENWTSKHVKKTWWKKEFPKNRVGRFYRIL